MKGKAITGTAALALAAVVLAGCSYPGDQEDRAAYAKSAGISTQKAGEHKDSKSDEADAGPTTGKGSKDDGSTATESAKGSKEAKGPAKSDYVANNHGPRVKAEDLVADSGTTYLKANDGGVLTPVDLGGPWLTKYVIDGDAFTYTNIPCVGHAATEATGTIKGGQVVWKGGVDPWGGQYGTSDLEVSGSTATLQGGGDVEAEKATADGVDDVKAQMRKLCQNAKPDPEPVGEAFQE
jgi:hypothetical protein